MPKLLLKFNAAVIKEIPVSKASMTVGRKEDNDVVIDNAAVSGHHCKIFSEGDIFYVEDTNSTNGTFLNEKKIVKAGLKHNDVIGIVKHTLVFVDDRAQVSVGDRATGRSAEADSQGRAAPAMSAPAAAPAPASQPAAAPATPAAAPAAGASVGILRVLSGAADKLEYILSGASTYIGKSDQMQIKIKGMLVPDVAAMIAKRQEGYFLCALKAGYPQLNGNPVQEKELLKNADQIEVGGTVFQFSMEAPK